MKFICKNNNNEKQIKSFISHLVSQNKKYNVHQSDTTHKVAFCVEYKGKDKLFIEWFDSIRNAILRSQLLLKNLNLLFDMKTYCGENDSVCFVVPKNQHIYGIIIIAVNETNSPVKIFEF